MYYGLESRTYIVNSSNKYINEVIVLTDQGYITLYSLNKRSLNSQKIFTYLDKEFTITLENMNNDFDVNTPFTNFILVVTSYGADVNVFVTVATKYNFILENAEDENSVEIKL